MDFVRELGEELAELSNIIDRQYAAINKYRLKIAMYKALFYHEYDLGERILAQIMENDCSENGYRTLEDMHKQGLISTDEYYFCSE